MFPVFSVYGCALLAKKLGYDFVALSLFGWFTADFPMCTALKTQSAIDVLFPSCPAPNFNATCWDGLLCGGAYSAHSDEDNTMYGRIYRVMFDGEKGRCGEDI